MNSNIKLPGFEGVIVTKSYELEGVFHIHVEMERKPHKCPHCEMVTTNVHDYRLQRIQHTKIFSRETFLFYNKLRYSCVNKTCGKSFNEENPLVDRYQRQSIEFKQALGLELIHGKNFKDTAERFNTSPTTVMRRFDEISTSMLRDVEQLPEVIAIDEYKGDAGGEKYQTIIADPINRKPLDILPDRRKDTLKNYLKQRGHRVKIVVMDMSPSFKAAVDEALGGPIVVADRFHFCRYIYWALESVRRKEQREFSEYDRKRCKRMRHVFYKPYEKLTDKQKWHLERYLNLSDYLRQAYELKEAYRKWFEEAKAIGSKDLKTIKKRLYQYYESVKVSGVHEFIKAISTFKNWQKEIMNSFAFELHNGYIEGINNQTKVIKRNAFGFRRFDRFRSKVLLHHQYKYIKYRVV